jgi:hypothetical protein
MLQEASSRRGGLLAMPWDPVSWSAAYSSHAAWLASTQAMLLPARLSWAEGWERGEVGMAGQDAGGRTAVNSSAVASAGQNSAELASLAAVALAQSKPASSTQSAVDAPAPPPSPTPAVTASAATLKQAVAAAPVATLTPELLSDMAAAVDFGRAAYGYAFLCGGMSSIYRYVHMQTVQRSVFDIIGGVSLTCCPDLWTCVLMHVARALTPQSAWVLKRATINFDIGRITCNCWGSTPGIASGTWRSDRDGS